MSITVSDVAGTSYTLQASDDGKLLRFTGATEVTITCPDSLLEGFEAICAQSGNGQLVFSLSGTSTKINPAEVRTRRNGSYISVTCEQDAVYKFNGELSHSRVPVYNNFNGIAGPTVSDDDTLGYSKGSAWIYDSEYFICIDATNGAAVWENIGGAAGILPTATSTKTTDYTVVIGDVGTRIILGSATVANRVFTLDVSLLADFSEQISFENQSDYSLKIIVSNTGTMTINNTITEFSIDRSGGVVTLSGDTATNCNSVSGYSGSYRYLGTSGEVSGVTEIAFTTASWFSAGFQKLVFEITDLAPATDTSFLNCRVSTDGGATYLSGTASYRYSNNGRNEASTVLGSASGAGTTQFRIGTTGVGNAVNEFISATVALRAPYRLERTYLDWVSHSRTNASVYEFVTGGGFNDASNIVDAIKFYFSAGNIASGEIKVYGVQA
jgi:hypothetical protein